MQKGSIIIPTFGRSRETVAQTINSILLLEDELLDSIQEIILADQNTPPLEINSLLNNHSIIYQAINIKNQAKVESNQRSIIHLTHFKRPSTTIAKNIAVSYSSGELLLFFDDDILIKKDSISNMCNILRHTPNIGVIGGRETVELKALSRSKFRNFLIQLASHFTFKSLQDKSYQIDNKYVGRILPNSFMLCNFDLISPQLIKVDTVRGCVWGTLRSNFIMAKGFDENFQGTALREETDLYLRIKRLGKQNYFSSSIHVIHLRQLGGCNNLSRELAILNSKLTNELYFQYKHFLNIFPVFFLIRLLPLVMDHFKKTKGQSALLLFKYFAKLCALKFSKNFRQKYDQSLNSN